MALLNTQRQYIGQLSERWGVSKEDIVNWAISEEFNIWVELYGVRILPEIAKEGTCLNDLELKEKIKLRLIPNALKIMLNKESNEQTNFETVSGFDFNGNRVGVISSILGGCIDLSLNDLFATIEDVEQFETAYKIKHNFDVLGENKEQLPQGKISNEISSKRERTLLKVAGALLLMKYQAPKYFKADGSVTAKVIADQFDIDLAAAGFTDDGLKTDTIRKTVIRTAIEAIAENRKEIKKNQAG